MKTLLVALALIPLGLGVNVLAAVPKPPAVWRAATSGHVIYLEASPALITGTPTERAAAFLKAHAADLGLTDPATEMASYREETDKFGVTHIHYAQKYQGLPVIGGGAVVHVGGGKPDSISAGLLGGLNVSVAPMITNDAALTVTMAAFVKDFPGEVPVVKASGLVVYDAKSVGNRPGSEARLAWQVVVENTHCPECSARADENYYVAAQTGGLLGRLSNIRRAGTFRKVYDCTPYAWSNACWSLQYHFADHYPEYGFGRGEGQSPSDPNPVYGGDDVNSLYGLVGSIHSYYFTKFGRNGANNQGGMGTGLPASSGIIYQVTQTKGQTYEDAIPSWTCPGASFDTGTINFCHGVVTPDLVAHEYSHGIPYFTFNMSGMVYSGESGSLDEDFSDVMGESVEKFISGGCDWLFGEGNAMGVMRSLIDPPSVIDRLTGNTPHPDRFHSPYFACGGGDELHHNSTIPSKAFYLISEGGAFNGCTIRGLGLDKVEQILYRTMTTYYTPSETFNAAHIAIQRAAADLYPDSDCWQVKKALQAVELDQPSPCSGATERTPYAATPFTAGDIGQALSIAAGLVTAGPADIGRLDVALTGDSFLKVDMRDAIAVARMVAGIDM